MAYSAIEEEDRAKVIQHCYWPLLRLAKERQLPFGIEASAWTLKTIANIDPNWLAELRDLVTHGPCEFIGCSYTQVIGPLVPAEVNAANLRIGMQHYKELLGLQPKIALVNEQAYSAGLVPLYLKAGYEAIIMEWNNSARSHPEWDPEWRYLPQIACGTESSAIPLIWNESVSFQKVQRYVHGEIELDEYLDYVSSHQGSNIRIFPIYGNDVEVFDFRPGRYMTETPLHVQGEWQRIDVMYTALQKQSGLEMVSPSAVLELIDQPDAGNLLHLETSAHPIPVKKQNKYNVVRWAISGRDDLHINTTCWRIFAAIKNSNVTTSADWAELCYLWSSDFRTHITQSRWNQYRQQLVRYAERWDVNREELLKHKNAELKASKTRSKKIKVVRTGRFLDIHGERFQLRFNCLRGLAIESLIDHSVSDVSLCGTLHHGYFDDIQWMADFYSGHLVFEAPGRAKITDLNPVEPEIKSFDKYVLIKGGIKTPLGLVRKQWKVDESQGIITLRYSFDWSDIDKGSLRLGYLTLNPEAFSIATLGYQTHNGGRNLETFPIGETNFDQGASVSSLISANQALGLTEGELSIGDDHSVIRVEIDKTQHAAIGLVSHQKIQNSYLCRIGFSLQETDDTSLSDHNADLSFELHIKTDKK